MSEVAALTEFLLARIAEDEAGLGGFGPVALVVDEMGAPTGQRRPTPRVLAECEAKRRIVALHAPDQPYCSSDVWEGTVHGESPAPCANLELLALPYADHPDYREEWRP